MRWRSAEREQLGLHKLTPEEMGERAVARREMRAMAEDDYGGFLPAETILPRVCACCAARACSCCW